MAAGIHLHEANPSAEDRTASQERIKAAVEHAGQLLPAQGPINVFIHHNTLHAFEDLPFAEAVRQGGQVFGCQPYLDESRYRELLNRGRIRELDLEAVLREDLGEAGDGAIPVSGTRLQLRLAMLRCPLRIAPAPELRWFVAETDALTRVRSDAPASIRHRLINETRHWVMRDVLASARKSVVTPHERRTQDTLASLFKHFGESKVESWSERTWESFAVQVLWRICRDGVHGLKAQGAPQAAHVRHRDVLLEATGEDADGLVHDVLIRYCAAFLDQGFAPWSLPHREQGMFRAFCELYRRGGGPPDSWLGGLATEIDRIEQQGLSAVDSLLESLELLGIRPVEWDEFLSGTLLALRGWAGMIREMERRGDRAALPAPAGSLLEFLAVRLILDRLAAGHIARVHLEFSGPLSEARHVARQRITRHEASSVDQRAFLVFQLAQVMGWTPEELQRLDKAHWGLLFHEIELFPVIERRRVFHLAFERRYRNQALDALALHASRTAARPENPRFQVVCCLDEREESFRRHLEELQPSIETFGVAGFFNTAIYFRGATDAHYFPLCPVVIRPQHWVEETIPYTLEDAYRLKARTRRALGTASHRVHLGSRTIAGGALLTAGLGVLASIPLVARVLLPGLTARIRRIAGRLIQPPRQTQLQVERSHTEPGAENGHVGFSVSEMTAIAERTLCDIGLTSGFARLVVILGHGSGSVNNPHRSAYDCGACGGNAGGPNARAVAQILNDYRVRMHLAQRGLEIPDTTVFVGGLHNTCTDAVTFFDLDRLPRSHQPDLEDVVEILDQAGDRNAHERSRRFQSAPLDQTFEQARRHVEDRSEDLAQTRPECGHATNALCIVGRRERTRGLYLDRRAFLTSYDPNQDDAECTILTRILQAAIPVCAGINLEYYFSYVDPTGFGCGTKLPHNVTSLLGIMDGTASDLRPGLPWQMVEIHEPVRLVFVVETRPEALLGVLERNAPLGNLCRQGWIQLATLDPDSGALHLFRSGKFEPYVPESHELPVVASSVEWYRGWRDHLGFAEINPAKSSADEKVRAMP